MAALVSIVVPVLNEAATLEASLRALAPLRAEGAELIVVDGGSSDGTKSLAMPWADFVLLSPRGRARQMNAGAKVARGKLLLFLHADTRLPDHALRDAVQALRESRRDWGRFDVRIAGRSRWLPLVAALMNLRSRLSGIATGDQAMFMRKRAFDAVGGFPDQPLMEDIELSRRLKRLTPPACLREKVVTSGRRWDRHGALRTIVLMWWLRFQYWRGISAEQLVRSWQ
jgi:rSAM/selenodomain-associated transferase 2